MTTTFLFLRLTNLVQALLAARGLQQSYASVQRLLQYEETSKKAAEWSQTAANELHKTRTTQTSGAIAVLASFLTALSLSALPTYFPGWLRFAASPTLLIGILLARQHIKSYWAPRDGKTVGVRIPMPKMHEYNEAQEKTQELLQTLEFLEYGWAVSSFVGGLAGWK